MHSNAVTRSYRPASAGSPASRTWNVTVSATPISPRVPQREFNGGVIKVESVHARHRVGTGDADAGPPRAAADIGHPRGRIGPQARVHIGDRGQPLGAELREEGGAVHPRLPLAHVHPIVAIRHTAARPEGVEQGGEGIDRADRDLRQRREVIEAIPLDKHLDMPGGDAESPRPGLRLRVLDGEDAGDRLLLQPLPRVALVACRSAPPVQSAVSGPASARRR